MVKSGIYKHFKGNLYRVHFVGRNSETLEDCVVYEALYENAHGKYWIRPIEMFEEYVVRDGKKMKRFEYISND